jgi:membrane protein required for colicin V production
MIWVDIAIIALLAIYSIIGIIRGYGQEAYALIVWIIGIIVAWFFGQDFAILLLEVGSQSTRLAVAFVALVFITLFVGGVINLLLAESVKRTGFAFLDRLGGLLLGFVHGLVVVFVLVVAAGLTPLPKDRWWQESQYLPPFQSLAMLVKGNIPSKLASSINYR